MRRVERHVSPTGIPPLFAAASFLPVGLASRRCALSILGAGSAFLALVLASLSAPPTAASQLIQLVSVRKYYTLFLASTDQSGRKEPRLREIFVTRFRNFGPSFVNGFYHDELPQQPYLEYRDSIDGRPVPVQKFGNRYWDFLQFPAGREIEVRTDALQRVLPRDPAQKIDFFEDWIEWANWRPPIDDYWIVVDLGKMYTAFRQTPAFGMGGDPPPTFREFLQNQVLRVLPAGYRVEGSTVWWHFRQIYAPEGYTTLHVEWKAWYR
ncbi:hypothetical protein MAMC_01072 [Methylacidimicrobium cyclopophantes]|uniref:Uncharacterized protein n=1 Tax=Methylacidimicrobium cyclopophantes TaxID=1041766 RepID=A0A5E6MF18_9BACT|nr:hypothetical protein [Methylacidimicrobium cyclopophantes]VVM06423.1 hypothetical protein MAMC_01072 [Methylacidimicrobium cyclopophantes]